jgi:hypothetical protein
VVLRKEEHLVGTQMSQTRKSKTPKPNGSCPKGYHPRKKYTIKKTGTKIPASCVRATTTSGETRKQFLQRTRRRMTRRLQGIPKSRRGVTSCPPGKIVRDAYVRVRNGKRQFLPAVCIMNVGKPGKGVTSSSAGIGPLRKGDLSRFGYAHVTSMTQGRRHLTLALAVKSYGSLTVWRKLNALYVYTRNTAPASSAIFKADRDWVKEYYGIRAFT